MQDHLVGISLRGQVLPFNLYTTGRSYLTEAQAEHGFVGFRLRRNTDTGDEHPLWITGMKQPSSPELVTPEVSHFAILQQGNCVYTTPGHGKNKTSSEAFFRVQRDKTTWNVLDSVERLPKLGTQFVDKNYIKDRMRIRVVDGFGTPGSLALCVFSHVRSDMRSAPVFQFQNKQSLEPMTWKRAVILTSDGQRYMTSLFRDGNVPEIIWLHNSAKVIWGKRFWQLSGSTKRTQGATL